MTRISNHKKLISTPVLVSYLFRIITKSANTCSTAESQLGHSTAEIFVNSCTSQLSFSQEHSDCISHLGRVWLASSPRRTATVATPEVMRSIRSPDFWQVVAQKYTTELWLRRGTPQVRTRTKRAPKLRRERCGAMWTPTNGRQPNAPLLAGHTGKT